MSLRSDALCRAYAGEECLEVSGFNRESTTNFLESTVSSSDRLPEMDLAYLGGKGYTAVSELMRAMILRTIEDLSGGPELRQEALDYLMDEDEEYVLSFHSICRYFGFNPEKTRHAILNSKTKIRTRRRAA